MEIKIIGKNYTVSDKLKGLIETKTSKFERYFHEDVRVVVLCKEVHNNRYTMEVTFKVEGQIIRAEVTSSNMYKNIDKALPKIEGQLRKYKTKLEKKIKQDAFNHEMLYKKASEVVTQKIVKQKEYELLHLSVDDAIIEMDLIDHGFYIFLNIKTNKVNVVYRRKDNDIGQIELEY